MAGRKENSMLVVCGLIFVVVGIIVALLQASTGLSMVVIGLLMFAMGYDLNAIRDRLPEPPKTAKQPRSEQEHQARLQKLAHLAEEARVAGARHSLIPSWPEDCQALE
jgi:hypothetical protein